MTTIAAETIGPARLVAVGTPEQPPLCALLVDTGKLESPDVDRALRLQKEQEEWERIAKTSPYVRPRKRAVARITDQSVLAEIAKTPKQERSVRLAAVKKLTDQKALADIARTANCGGVCRAARKRLKELHREQGEL